ncbi:hypothetical protein [Proteus mirabilis]|uniref:hypothetical protein n=1 Tax=Proteus mirabilis TaxID=584 RepID=UPI0034D41CFE
MSKNNGKNRELNIDVAATTTPTQPAKEPVVNNKLEALAAAAEQVIAEQPIKTTVVEEKQPDFKQTQKEPIKRTDGMSDLVKVIINRLNTYVSRMKPGAPQSEKEGVQNQIQLYRLIQEITKLDPIEFKIAMDALLDLIYENRAGAFSDLYTLRYFEALSPRLTDKQIIDFSRMLSLFTTVGQRTNRSAAAKQVDLALALAYMPNAEARQKMAAYFEALKG